MNLALAKGAGTNTHVLRSVPQTIHWGFFDGALAPVLTIDSGDCVVVECVSGNPEWMPAKSSGFEVLPELRQIHEQVKRGTGNHILTGPIFVNGAEVGDVLEVRILDIEMRQNWGYNLFRAYGGTLPDEFPYYRIIHIALDRERNRGILPSGLAVPTPTKPLAEMSIELVGAPGRMRNGRREPPVTSRTNQLASLPAMSQVCAVKPPELFCSRRMAGVLLVFA